MTRSTELDANGVEFAIEEGFGRIVSVDWPEAGKRNAKVEMDGEGLRYPVKGWADIHNAELRSLLEDPPARVQYRIETHRDKKANQSTPIDDLEAIDKYRRLIVLTPADASGAERRVPNLPPQAPPPPPSGGHVTDTWAYCAALGSVELAYDLAVAARNDGRIDNVTRPMVEAAGRVLLDCASAAQSSVRGAVDLNANSHTRARGAIRSAVGYAPPPPFELATDDDAWGEWAGKITRAAGVLMAAALELLNGDKSAAEAGPRQSQPSAEGDSSTDEAAGGDDSPAAGSPLDRLNALRLSGKEIVEFRDLVVANGLPWPLKDLTAEQLATFGELLAAWAQDAA